MQLYCMSILLEILKEIREKRNLMDINDLDALVSFIVFDFQSVFFKIKYYEKTPQKFKQHLTA